jgi:signal transduction histidine kinase
MRRVTSISTPEQLQAELDLRQRQIEAIRRVSQALCENGGTVSGSMDELLSRILSIAVEALGADVGSLQLYDEASDRLVFRCVFDPASERLKGQSYPASQGIGGAVFRSGVGRITQRVQETEFNRAIDDLTGYHTESLLTAPLLRIDGPCIGVMQVLNARRPFDSSDLAVLETIGAQAATAIETARLGQEARRAELVNVIGDIAHDIKNMLTPLHSGALTLQMLIEDALAEHPDGKATLSLAANYNWILEGSLESAERVQSRTRDIADAVKGELAPPNFALDDANDVVREVLRALRSAAESAGVELIEDLDESLGQTCFDHKQLFNAIYNLVNNALPETPSGGAISVATRRDEAGGNTHWQMQVRDTGRGMPPEVREKLFTDAAISTKPGGTGLGTRIVAGVVRRHGGTIEVSSEPGQGTTFLIRLPREPR